MTRTQTMALVNGGRWVGNAYRAYRWYLRGDEGDQLVAQDILTHYRDSIEAAKRTSAAAKSGRRYAEQG